MDETHLKELVIQFMEELKQQEPVADIDKCIIHLEFLPRSYVKATVLVNKADNLFMEINK